MDLVCEIHRKIGQQTEIEYINKTINKIIQHNKNIYYDKTILFGRFSYIIFI